MSRNSLFFVYGDSQNYREAERVKDALSSKMESRYECQTLKDLGGNITPSKFKSAASRVQAILFFCSEDFKNRLDKSEPITFDADGNKITLERNAVYSALEDRSIKDKFILLSFDTPMHIPGKLRDKSQDDIFMFRRNMQGKDLIDALRRVVSQIQRK
uniref:J2 crystallin n=1 Tax=Tripedalia cystophora TaxID=6141 RepID=A9XFX4_TRICY|nr:J2 crystallin [Tripedalia cystophora]